MNTQRLSPRRQSVVTSSAFAASGDLEKQRTALSEGLNGGLTVNDIKEILVQLSESLSTSNSLSDIGVSS